MGFLSNLFGFGKRKEPSALSTPDRYFGNDANWKYVTSSNVAMVAYYADLQTGKRILGVRFKSGGEYWYYDVPLSVYTDMLSASSKGRFVWSDLRDRYP